jgi:hypothetical protein
MDLEARSQFLSGREIVELEHLSEVLNQAAMHIDPKKPPRCPELNEIATLLSAAAFSPMASKDQRRLCYLLCKAVVLSEEG